MISKWLIISGKHIFKYVSLVLLLVFIPIFPTPGQKGIAVTVFDGDTNAPVRNAYVKFIRSDMEYNNVTDSTGRCAFEAPNLPPSRYKFIIKKEGYIPSVRMLPVLEDDIIAGWTFIERQITLCPIDDSIEISAQSPKQMIPLKRNASLIIQENTIDDSAKIHISIHDFRGISFVLPNLTHLQQVSILPLNISFKKAVTIQVRLPIVPQNRIEIYKVNPDTGEIKKSDEVTSSVKMGSNRSNLSFQVTSSGLYIIASEGNSGSFSCSHEEPKGADSDTCESRIVWSCSQWGLGYYKDCGQGHSKVE